MKKLFLAASIASLMLSACGTHDETDEPNKQQVAEKKEQHKVTRKDGVTYVDGHLLVNKKVSLPSDYAPGENAEARKQLDRMIQESRQDDVNLVFRSGFRSYETQQQLYRSYVSRDGEAAADKYSAKPGHSEHQSGLAFDVGSVDASDDFKTSFVKTPEGQWVKDHAHKYGFIIRYPEGKEAITGYQYEPWHLRYVGKELAQTIHNEETTLEEYFEVGQ
ncbi:M15 family metallopeptidase [Staphylococcus sp. IVB6227]|nr:M15 family metallopeptidase [Staphylococcus sp. IVB6227]UXR77766.1 M15 family metallopeptidase [Staphylococcus sp. IVB6227]